MTKREKVIITTGMYDPLTVRELDILKKCKARGDWLVVGVHSDWWMQWAQGGFIQSYDERKDIVKSIKYVDEIFTFDDMDGTVCQLLKLVKYCYPNSDITYVSEEDMHNMPETKIKGITFETMK
jgi:cytidyltransferase-like protein